MYCLNKNPGKRPSASQCLEHPFMKQAAQLPREQILTEIVKRVQLIKEKKKQGLEITEEDELSPISTIMTNPSTATSTPSKVSSSDATPTLSKARKLLNSISGSILPPSTPAAVPSAPSQFTTLAVPSADIKEGEHTLVASSFSDYPPVVNHVAEGDIPVLEPIALASIVSETCTAEFLDAQYILIGCEKGLFFLDITKPQQKTPIPIIHDVRFTQLQILHEYNVLIALSGRHSHIRQYSLASIRKLILYVEGNPVKLVADSNTSLPIQNVKIGQKQHDDYSHLKDTAGNNSNETMLVSEWTNDYIKIPDTRESKSFSIELTETSAYLVVILYQGITLFRWAVAPYSKFMKIKSFWVPETPLFVSFAQDGLAPVDLFIGYTSELNRVAISDSRVSEVGVHKEMKTRGMSKPRWQCIKQIPFPDSKLEQLLRESSKGTSNRKLAAISGPTLTRSKVTMSERYFLGTYNKLTKVVDANGYPMIGAGVGGWKDGVMWSEPPIKQILRPLQHVMSTGRNTLEIVEWKTASLKQRLTLDESSSFKILSSVHGYTLLGVEKKKKGVMIYWMRESSPSPRAPGDLMKKIQSEMSRPVEVLTKPLTSSEVEKMAADLESISITAASQAPPPSQISSNPTAPFFDGETSSPSSNEDAIPYSPPTSNSNPYSPPPPTSAELLSARQSPVLSPNNPVQSPPAHQFGQPSSSSTRSHPKRTDSVRDRAPPISQRSYTSAERRYLLSIFL